MYEPSLQKFPVFAQIIHGVDHHKIAILLGVIAVLCLVYVLNIPVAHQMSIQQSSAGSTSSAGIVQPLTLVDDPQYAHEYDIRAQYINAHLELLRKTTQADKAYVVSYSYGLSRFGDAREKQISSTFEVGQEGLISQMIDYQGFLRRNWLHLKRNDHSISGLFPVLFPQSYGIELHDEHGAAIGYLGIDCLQKKPSSWGSKLKILRQTADSITAGLLQPIENLNSLEAK